MAQKPFIMDAGLKTGEWSITETENGDLKVSPNTTGSGSQRLFNADAGVKMGDWKFYNEGNHLNLTPNGVSTVGLPTQYDFTDVSAVTKSLEVEFYSNNPTGGYVQVGEVVAANSTHAFFLEGRSAYSELILSAVNLTTGTTDYTISPESGTPDNGIVANDSYVLIATGNGGKLYSTSTQQLVGTIPINTGHKLFKMTDNYVATMSSNDTNQIDVRELDPANNFPLVNSFTGSSSEQFGHIGRFDLSDTHIVIGSPYYTSDYQATDYQEQLGKVEVFNIQSGVLEHTFYGRDGIHHTSTASSTVIRFGNGIAIDGDNVAINTKASNSVAEGFRVYNYKTGELVTVGNRPTWGTDSSKYLNDLGHEAFAASGGLVFLYTGSLRDGSLYDPNQAVFVYNYSGEMVLRIDDPDISTSGQYYQYTYFGKSLAVSGDKLILGARAYSTTTDAGGADTAIGYHVGKGYVYDLTKTYAEIAQEPTVSDSSQRPFIVDAGIRVGSWSIVQGLNGHLLASTSAEVLLAGELPQPAITYNFASTSLTNTVSGNAFEDYVGSRLAVNGTTLMSSHAGSTPAVKFYDTETGELLNEFDTSQAQNNDMTGFNSEYFIGSHWNEPSGSGTIWVYDMSSGNLVKQIQGQGGVRLGGNVNMNDTYIISTFQTAAYKDKLAVYEIANVLNDDMTPTLIQMPYGAPISRISNIVNNKVCASEAVAGADLHVFDISTGTLLQTITNPLSSNNVNDFFGYSIAMTDTHVAVNAKNRDDASVADPDLLGYVFEIETGNLVSTFSHSDAETTTAHNYNVYVALNDDYVFFGSVRYMNESGETPYSGKVFVFDINTGTLVNTIENPNSAGTSDGDRFGQGIAVAGGKLFVGAPNEDNTTTSTGSIYTFSAAIS